MAKARRRRSAAQPAGAGRQPGSSSSKTQSIRGPNPGTSNAQARTEWLRWIPVAIGAAVLLAGLAAWRVLPALSGEQSATTARPIAALNAPDVHSLLIDPENPDRVLFGSHAGTQESLDGGVTWRSGTLTNADAMSMSTSPDDPTTLYVAGHDVFLVSRDGGQTWQPVEHDLPGTDLHAFAQDPNDPRRLYALVVGAGIMTSADGGATWDPVAQQPPGLGGHGALATNGPSLYAVTQSGLVVSHDQGNTWEPPETQPAGPVISLAIPAAASETLYAGTASGLAKSTDGGTNWTTLGPDGVPVLALAVAPSDSNRVLFVSENGAVYRSDDGGATWSAPE